MAKKLSEDQILKFVSLYRENACLWDISSEDYKNKPMRQFALQNLCNGMEIEGFTVEDVKNKIKNIRSTYYLELDKIKKSSTSGACGNVYEPKLKWFAEFNSFIKNAMVKRKTHESKENTDNAQKEENTENGQSKENTDNAQSSDQSENPTHTNLETNLSEPRKKRSKISQLSVKSSMKELQLYSSKPEIGEDEFDVFGKHVAKQLRTLSIEQAILGQEEIQSVITRCRLRDLKYRNMTVSSPAYSADTQVSDDYAPRPSTSTSTYTPLKILASTVDTQSTDDLSIVNSNDPEYMNKIMNAFNIT